MPSPFVDRFGNAVIAAPKTPNKVLFTVTPDAVRTLIEAASCDRDKVIFSLLAASGVRRGELTSIQVRDLNLEYRRIKVEGMGGKDGYLVFGATTEALIARHLQEARPNESLSGTEHPVPEIREGTFKHIDQFCDAELTQ